VVAAITVICDRSVVFDFASISMIFLLDFGTVFQYITGYLCKASLRSLSSSNIAKIHICLRCATIFT
jgi:hypothetical protein